MTELHGYIAYSVPAAFGLLALWALYCLIRNREPNEWYWRLLALVQVILGVQVLIGGVLYLMGRRANPNAGEWLHYVYGGLFPIFVLLVAHRFARRDQQIAWLAFGAAAFVNFGLTFRALQTGLGTD